MKCRNCPGEARPGRSTCAACSSAKTDAIRDERATRFRVGLCAVTGCPEQRGAGVHCHRHREQARQRTARWHQARKEARP